MKILFCDTSFGKARKALARLLPHDEVLYCPRADITELIGEVDVAIPLMSPWTPTSSPRDAGSA